MLKRVSPDDLVFTTPSGSPVDTRNFKRILSRVADKAGLAHWSPHGLRHSAVTLLLTAGVPVEIVSEVVGHSSIRVTKDVYGHLVDGQRQTRRRRDGGPPR